MENLRDLPLAQMVPRKNSYCLTYIQNFHTLYISLIHLTYQFVNIGYQLLFI